MSNSRGTTKRPLDSGYLRPGKPTTRPRKPKNLSDVGQATNSADAARAGQSLASRGTTQRPIDPSYSRPTAVVGSQQARGKANTIKAAQGLRRPRYGAMRDLSRPKANDWSKAEETYSAGRWSDDRHQDGSRYYRSPDGNLYKVWSSGKRQKMPRKV